MRNILTKSIVAGMGFFCTMGILSFVYAAYTSSIPSASEWGTLTTSGWNQIITEITAIGENLSNFSFSSGNVGVGVPTPGAKLEVAGNIIASDPTSANHVATKTYVDAAVSAAGGASYVGKTTTTYTGNLGGIFGANAKCQAVFAGSHMCSVNEIIKSGATSIPVNGWVTCETLTADSYVNCDGFPKLGSVGTSGSPNCSNWTSSSTGGSPNWYYGIIFTDGGSVSVNLCNTVNPIHCCK